MASNGDENLKRRGTTHEEASQVLIEPKSDEIVMPTKKKLSTKERIKSVGNMLYNSEYREFLGRDAKAWFKLSVFYFIFYLWLSGFFVLLLLAFYMSVDSKKPTYYNTESVMHYKEVNPGLGFRPQPDPESDLIVVNTNDYKKNFQSLDFFLTKYEQNKENNYTGAHGNKVVFNYENLIKDTPCSRENFFGYNTTTPCVVVKLNRIFGWLPKSGAKAPYNISKIENEKKYYVYVACRGESTNDKAIIGAIDYYSTYPNQEIGGIDFKYFPYRNQPGYLSPLVFVRFKALPLNQTVNVECKAYAANIDNTDRVNRRGMVKFQVRVLSK